ncbi:uncharacterized protein C2orf16 homolog [Gracilinanus agilis]|uniref:uncharacterized protein C2orf16 homolog n=1 Tax=Gracilinanus agilis TaxID=191870 RepID=UPI001CFCD306|nr:uncharacterized protein C2orf16 homolog [Gracilinanus agilis]
MEPILGPGPPLPPSFSLLLLLGLLVIGVWSLLPGARRQELLSAKFSETLKQLRFPGTQDVTKVPLPHWEDNVQIGYTGANLACFSGLPVGWAQNYTLWSMDKSFQHIFQHLDIARSSLMNLSFSSQMSSIPSSSSSTNGPEDSPALTCYEGYFPEFDRIQKTSSLHTNLGATQSLAYIFSNSLQHRSQSVPLPSKKYFGQAQVFSLPPFLFPEAKNDTRGKNIFLDKCTYRNHIHRWKFSDTKVEKEEDSWVPIETKNSLELHIKRKLTQRLVVSPTFRTIKLSLRPEKKTTNKGVGNSAHKISNLHERPPLSVWAPIQLSPSARLVLEGHMAWKVCTLRDQTVPTAVKQSWATLNCITEEQIESHKPGSPRPQGPVSFHQNTVKSANKKSSNVSCSLLSRDLERDLGTNQKKPITPKSTKADRESQSRLLRVTQDASCSGVYVIPGNAIFLQEDTKKKLELCIEKRAARLLEKDKRQQMEALKEGEELSTGQLQTVIDNDSTNLLETMESVSLDPGFQVQVKDSKKLTSESHSEVTDSSGLNSVPQVQDRDSMELTSRPQNQVPQVQGIDEGELIPVPQKKDVDSLELKGSSSKVQGMDTIATISVPEKHDTDNVELTPGSPIQDVDFMGPTSGPKIKNVDSGGLTLGSQVKLTDSKGLNPGSQITFTDSKGLLSPGPGSQTTFTDSKGLSPGSQITFTDSKGLNPGSQITFTDSKGLSPGSQITFTDSKGLSPGSQIKLTDSKGLSPGSQITFTDSKGLSPGSQIKLTDSKGLSPGSQFNLTDSKGLSQGSQIKLTDSKDLSPWSEINLPDFKSLSSGSQIKLTDFKGLSPGSQIKLTDSKGLSLGSQITFTDSKGLGPGSQITFTDSKGLSPGSQINLTDSKGLSPGSEINLTDSKGLSPWSQINLTDSKGLSPGSQIKFIDSKGLSPGSQIKLTDSKGLSPGSQFNLTDSNGLSPGSQVKLTDSKGLSPGSQIKFTDSNGLSPGSQIKFTDSKGLSPGSQIKFTDSKGLSPGSQIKFTDSKGLSPGSQITFTDSKGLSPGSQITFTDSKGLSPGSQITFTDSKGLSPGSQITFTDSKGLSPGSQITFTDSKGLSPGSQITFTDSKGLSPGSQITFTDSKGLSPGSQITFTDSKGLSPGSQITFTDSKGLSPGSQITFTDSKGLSPGSQITFTDSKGLSPGSQITFTDSKGLSPGSQITFTDSKGLTLGSQIKFTDSKSLSPGSQLNLTDSKGLSLGSQINLTDFKGLSPGSQIKFTDSKSLSPGSQIKLTDSNGLSPESQINLTDSKGLALKPHVQVKDFVELTPWPRIPVVNSVELTPTPEIPVIDSKKLTLDLQSPIEDSSYLSKGSTLQHISSSGSSSKLKQGLYNPKTQEILKSILDLTENIVLQKPLFFRPSSKFYNIVQPSAFLRPLFVQRSHSLSHLRLTSQHLFQSPLLPCRSKNNFCPGLRPRRDLKFPVSGTQVKASERQISKGRVERRSSSTSILKNLLAKIQKAYHIKKAHVQRPPQVPCLYVPNWHFVSPRQMVFQSQQESTSTPPKTSLSINNIQRCQLGRNNFASNEQLEHCRFYTTQDYPSFTTKEAQGSSRPMKERKEREQVPSELSELPQNNIEKDPASMEQNEKPGISSQITSESQHRPLPVTSSHEQAQLLQDLQLKITEQLLKSQLSPHFIPSQTKGMVLKYPLCLQCGRCSGPNCPHKFHDSLSSWLLVYPQLRLVRNSEGHGEFRVHLGFKLRTRNQTPKHQREVGPLVSTRHESSQSDPSEKRKVKVSTCHATEKNFTLSPCHRTDLGPESFHIPKPSQAPEPIQVHIKRNLPSRRVEVAKAGGESGQNDFTKVYSLLDTDNEGSRARVKAEQIPDLEKVKLPKEIKITTQKTEGLRQSTPNDIKPHPKRKTSEAQKVAPSTNHSEKSTGLVKWLCLNVKKALGVAYPPVPFQQIHASRARPPKQQGYPSKQPSHVQPGSETEGMHIVKSLGTTGLATKMERKRPESKKTETLRLGPPLNNPVSKDVKISYSRSFLRSMPQVPKNNRISESRPSHRLTSPVAQ